jgi:hypothetical protein
MAIDNLQKKCEKRVEDRRKLTKHAVKHKVEDEDTKPDNYNKPTESVTFARKQLGSIKSYLNDYIEIIINIQKEPVEGEKIKGELTKMKEGGLL